MAIGELRRASDPPKGLRGRLSPDLRPDVPAPTREMPRLPPAFMALWHRQSERWMQTLDALAPYALAFLALIVTQGSWPASQPGAALVLLVIAALVVGTGWRFFRPLPDSHATWPVALVLLAVIFPLMAMHAQNAHTALVTPVPIHLVPLAFTWTALVIIALLTAASVIVMTREQPHWAGVTLVPLAVAFGWLPLLALRATECQWFAVALMTFALAEIASGVAWFLPERARWFVAPLSLAVGAWAIVRDGIPSSQTLPGRPLLLLDLTVIAAFVLLTLAAPFICRRLTLPRIADPALAERG